MKKALSYLAAGTFALLLLSGCSPGGGPEAELVGVYAVKSNGVLKELVKIERQGGRYIMRDKVRTPEWSEPKMQMQPVTREAWRRITTDTGNTAFVGVASEQLGVFKVPPGWKKNDFSTATGYFLFYSRGPVEAHKL
ncbi:hypothetical protein [Variovorax paradoxus]|jgi:hypothetical protein|uniref:hypothetical protein n=1 Tax=Variovorax paradoxus TaxID=34073 RepID=UPI002480684A|nr:hypothetical protein [Variovorax paradoxus]WGT63434.1 hypothetical protein QHG62_25940 [Variovorax paradoxus]